MREAIAAHLDSRQVSRVIYGSIVGLALVLALELHPPDSGVIIASLLGTAVAVALAELYSEIIGTETRTRHTIRRADLGHMIDDALAVAFGIAFPAVFFVLAAAGAWDRDVAFDLARWSGLVLISAYGFAAARLAGAGLWTALVHALVVALVGGALIAFKALVH